MKEKEEIKKRHPIRNFFIIIILLIGGTIAWARFISTKGLIVKEYSIINNTLPESFHGFKMIQFSDLHYGRTTDDNDLDKLVKTINSLKPDIVVFTGDLIDKDIVLNDKSKQNVIDRLKKIDATIQKYSIKGNHDHDDTNYEDIINAAEFVHLENEKALIYYKGETPIEIIGFPSSIREHPEYEKAFGNIEEQSTYYKIVLAHEPDIIKEIGAYNVDLMLSGHSHGGQIRIPLFGAVFTPVGAKTYYDEYYKVDNTDLYVSSGIGTSEANFRFLNKPSINFFRLYTH